MKILIILMLFYFNCAFSQLDESKEIIDRRLVATNIIPKKRGNFREEIKLSNKTFDTIKIWYNSQNLAKLIAVSNFHNGIDNNYYDSLLTHLCIGFIQSNSIKIKNQEFFYDSKMKKLIIKHYSLEIKNKLIEVLLVSDFDLIKNKLPQVLNW